MSIIKQNKNASACDSGGVLVLLLIGKSKELYSQLHKCNRRLNLQLDELEEPVNSKSG